MTDKKKHIEEMAKDVTGTIVWCSLEDDFLTVDGFGTAEALYEMGYRKQFEGDFMEVVRCKDCAVPHNKWTGCPNLNGVIPPPEFFCAKGERKREEMKGGAPDV